MRGVVALLAIVVGAGCYRRAYEDPCTVPCGSMGDCPAGLVCNTAQKMCAEHQTSICQATPTDAVISDNLQRVDASPTACSTVLGSVCVVGNTQLTLPGMINTTQPSNACNRYLPQTGGPPLCVIDDDIVTAGATVMVVGDSPLVIAAHHIIITTNATLDVSGGHTFDGPGVFPMMCPTPIQSPFSRGGGSGGTRGTRGGAGGAGAGSGAVSMAGLPNSPIDFIGGCPGDRGDGGASGGGFGGRAGGAVFLFASVDITIDGGGGVKALGAGGRGASSGANGGGGGGSGGVIALEAPVISWAGAVMVATGGSGGTGSTTSASGVDGQEGGITNAARTGTPPSGAGAGGSGSYKTLGGDGGNGFSNGGGGGGGGGDGKILIYGAPSGTPATLAPAPIVTT